MCFENVAFWWLKRCVLRFTVDSVANALFDTAHVFFAVLIIPKTWRFNRYVWRGPKTKTLIIIIRNLIGKAEWWV